MSDNCMTEIDDYVPMPPIDEYECVILRKEVYEALRVDAELGRMMRTEDPAVVEALAAVEHERWAGWMRYQAEKVDLIAREERHLRYHPSGEWYVGRWERLIDTPYSELTEQEKESDRIEVHKTLAALRAALGEVEDGE